VNSIAADLARLRGEVGKKQEKKMTPDRVKLVQESFAKVAPISETAAVLSPRSRNRP